LSLLKRYNPKQTIIFSNFKFNVERISKFLNDNQYPSVAISSLLTQSQRNKVIEQFKAENEHNILVATDVAARGLDIKGVDLVINYELPMDSESYVHRIGRTGRAGTEGKAFSLVCDKDVESLSRIEDYLKNKLAVGWLEESDMVQEFKKFPRENDAVFADRRREEAHGGGSRGGGYEGRGDSRGGGRSGGGYGGRSRDGGRARDGGHAGGNAGENRSGGRRQHHRVAGKEGAVASAGASVDSKDVSLQGKDRGTQQHRHKRPAHHDKSGADKQHHKHGDHKHSERSRGKFQDKPYVKKSHPHSEKQGSHHASKHKKPTTVVGKVKNFFKNLFG
jgi:ATP-dependent RNA helicase RhlB